MIGISFYLNDPLAEKRIIDASRLGVRNAFTSLHLPEESGNLVEKAKRLLKVAKENDVEVYADVSLHTPEHLGIPSLYELKALGVVGIRLDDYFDTDVIIELSKYYKIALNASILLENELNRLMDHGLDMNRVIGWHNFYPRENTGLSESFFLNQQHLYKKYHVPICAYVVGDEEKRGPLFNGLPTLEKHRKMDPFHAAVELKYYGVDHIYVGDPGVNGDLLHKLLVMDKEHVLPIRIKGSKLVNKEYMLRPDTARDVLRVMNTRTTKTIAQENTMVRKKGSITMDNYLYGRYQGEIQITLTDLPADQRVNVIGSVIEEDFPLLNFIKPGQKLLLQQQ